MPSFLQRRRLGAILFVFIVLGASMALAQDNPQNGENPWQEDTSNWCDAGNVWGDGRCNTDDEALTNWLYNAGWWFQRVTEGDITPCEVPEDLGGGANCTIGQSITINTPAGPIGIIFYLTGTGNEIGTTCNATCQANGTAINGNNFIFETYAPANSMTNDTSTRLIIHGNDNRNYITGSYGDDTIYGNGDDDEIRGDSRNEDGSGDDTIYGGDGDDIIYGDSVFGTGSGNDTIDGGDGIDRIYGDSTGETGSGNDTIDGGDGDDAIYGDSFSGTSSGDDTIDGGDGDDLIFGDSRLGTGSGDDTIDGGAGNDTIYGDSSNAPGSGDDTIESGLGNDTVEGGGGINTCTNDGGTDTTSGCP
jgi:Ca2+-binding RTX toxin-like protein